MIVEYIRYELKQNSPDALIAAYREASSLLRAAPECLGYDLAQRDDAPNSLILRIQWQSAEAHMQGFRKGPQFPPFLALIRPFIGEIAEMKHYRQTDVQWRREG
jgi:quinol monooxygenase YgiN